MVAKFSDITDVLLREFRGPTLSQAGFDLV